MKKILAISLIAFLAACGGSNNDSATDPATQPGAAPGAGAEAGGAADSAQQARFLADVYQVGLGEIELAQLAVQRSDDENARSFAQRVLDHHSYLNEQIAVLLQEAGVTLPTQPTADALAQRQRLGELDGDEFDRAYAQHSLDIHRQLVADVRTQIGLSGNVGNVPFASQDSIADATTATGDGGATGATIGIGTGATAGTTTGAAGDAGAGGVSGTSGNAASTDADAGVSSGAGSSGFGTDGDPGAGAGSEAEAAAANVRNFTANLLPALQIHLLAARTLAGALDPDQFLANLYQDGLAEVRAAELALQRAVDPELRAYAQRMLDEHTRANGEITQAAQVANATLPAQISDEQEAVYQRLSQLQGADFDKAYMNHNVLMHEAAVAQARAQSEQADDVAARLLALRLLPELEQHRVQADQLYQRLQPTVLFGAVHGGSGEILLAQLALQLSADASVRQFAQALIVDHSAANAQALQLARAEEIALPAEPGAEFVRAYIELSQMEAGEFERAFLERNVRFHQQTLQLFESADRETQSPQVREFVEATIPVLRAHLQSAQLAQAATDGAGAASSATTEGDGEAAIDAAAETQATLPS